MDWMWYVRRKVKNDSKEFVLCSYKDRGDICWDRGNCQRRCFGEELECRGTFQIQISPAIRKESVPVKALVSQNGLAYTGTQVFVDWMQLIHLNLKNFFWCIMLNWIHCNVTGTNVKPFIQFQKNQQGQEGGFLFQQQFKWKTLGNFSLELSKSQT